MTLVSVLLIAALAVGCTFSGAKGQDEPDPEQAAAMAQQFLDRHTEAELLDQFVPATYANREYASTAELTSDDLFRMAVLISDEMVWYDEASARYVIPVSDLTEILDAHLVSYQFDATQVSYGTYDAAANTISAAALGFGTGMSSYSFGSAEILDDGSLCVRLSDLYSQGMTVTAKVTEDGVRFVSCVSNADAAVSGFDSAPLFDLPESLRDKVTVVKGEANRYGVTLAAYYMTADYDQTGDDPERGRLCFVRQLTGGQFEDAYLESYLVTSQRFPGQDGQFFYEVCSPSDMPFSDATIADVEGLYEIYDILYDWLDGIFAADPAISPIDLSATPFVDDFSYGGNHIYVTIYPYNDPENPDAETWTLVLSQPVTQGEGGIWCAERLYYGAMDADPFYILPDTDLTAADYYAQLQAQADAGQAVDCSTTPLSVYGVTTRYFIDQLDNYFATYGDVYSANKGAARADGMGAAITGANSGSFTPADQAKKLYAAIVGTTSNLDFTMEVDDGGVTKISFSGGAVGNDGGWCTNYTGNYLADFDWNTVFSDRAPSGSSLTMTSDDGQTWLRCWSDSDLVLLHQDGADSWMTAAPPSGPDSSRTVYQALLYIAETVLRQQAFDVAVPEDAAGGGPTEVGVLLAYTRQVVENLKALPDWVQCRPLDAAVKSVTVTQTYFGGACPNFCAAYALYLDVGDPMSARAGEWQAGAGLDTETAGDYAGWSVWYIGSDFYYDAASHTYRCGGRYTGGEVLTFPHALEDATLEELLDDLNFTSSGSDHDNRIPRRIFERFSLSKLNAALLAYHPDEPWRANTIAKSLGTFLNREDGSDIPAYDTVYAALDKRFHFYLEEGSKETPSEPVTYYAADFS